MTTLAQFEIDVGGIGRIGGPEEGTRLFILRIFCGRRILKRLWRLPAVG